MKLRNKLSILMVITVAIPIILCVSITYFFIRNSITKIEVDNSKAKIENAQSYINSLIKSQEEALGGWTPWTDFYTDVENRDLGRIKSDLGDPKEDSPVEILGVIDMNYNPVYFSETAPKEWLNMNFKDVGFVKGLNDNTHFSSNIEVYKGGVYLVGIAKITYSEDTKFSNYNGYLILARKFNISMLQKGEDILGIDFAVRFNKENLSTNKSIHFLSTDIPKEVESLSEVDREKITVFSEVGLKDKVGNYIGTIHIESTSNAGVKALNLLLICFGVILVVTLVCSIGVTSISIQSSIIKPLKEIINVTEETSKRNLTVKANFNSNNEIGMLTKDINIMIDNLGKVISKVANSSEQVAALSEELTSSSEENSKATEHIVNTVQEIVEGAVKQCNKVNEASETISKLSSIIEDVSNNAHSASDLSLEALKYAKEGYKAVQIVENEMNNINEVVTHSAFLVEKLGENSKEIDKILHIIKSIASQTNLLSLNAAIEASRAGEQGKGFAVVAEEIRKLANQSSESIKQIAQIVEDIQKGSVKAVESMKHETEQVKKGTVVVNEAEYAFKRILISMEKVSNEMQDISELMKDMSQNSKSINRRMNEVSDIATLQSSALQTVAGATEEQCASMEEIASSANTLAGMAQELRILIERFRV